MLACPCGKYRLVRLPRQLQRRPTPRRQQAQAPELVRRWKRRFRDVKAALSQSLKSNRRRPIACRQPRGGPFPSVEPGQLLLCDGQCRRAQHECARASNDALYRSNTCFQKAISVTIQSPNRSQQSCLPIISVSSSSVCCLHGPTVNLIRISLAVVSWE